MSKVFKNGFVYFAIMQEVILNIFGRTGRIRLNLHLLDFFVTVPKEKIVKSCSPHEFQFVDGNIIEAI